MFKSIFSFINLYFPGDPHRETYRLSTYKDFPTDCQVDVRRLARNGFYFTGFKDRVKCFRRVKFIDNRKEPTLCSWIFYVVRLNKSALYSYKAESSALQSFHFPTFTFYSCGQCVQDWTISDNPDDPGWHRHDCQHARGQDTSNVPIRKWYFLQFLVW